MFRQKSAAKNFSVDDLPSNRKEVFFDRIKNQFSVFALTGLLFFLFALPLLVDSFVFDILVYLQSTSEGGMSDAAYYSYLVLFSGIRIPCLLILSIGCAGIFRIYRNLAWEIPVFFKEDFKEGVQKNAKPFLIVFFLLGVLGLASEAVLGNLALYELVRYLPLGILTGVIGPMFLVSLNIFNLYNAKIFEAFRLALRFFFGQFFKSVLVYILVISPFALAFISRFMIKYLVAIPVIILLVPILLFAWFLFNCYLFDRYMNKENYPEIFDKGIHRKKGL